MRSASEIEITMVGSREVFEAPMIAGSSELQVPCNWCILPPFATEDDIHPMWINLTQPPIRVGDILYTSMFLVVVSTYIDRSRYESWVSLSLVIIIPNKPVRIML